MYGSEFLWFWVYIFQQHSPLILKTKNVPTCLPWSCRHEYYRMADTNAHGARDWPGHMNEFISLGVRQFRVGCALFTGESVHDLLGSLQN